MDISHDVGMLAVRLGIGMIFAAHGVQKLFGWFGGYGLKGTGGFFEGFGFRPGALFATPVLENHRTAVRNIRRDIKEAVDKLEKEKKISQDEQKRTLDELARLGGDIFDRQVRPALRPEPR